MNNDLISWYLKEEDPKKGVKRSPTAPPAVVPGSTATPSAAAPAATVTPTDTKTTVTPSQPVTPTVTHPTAGYVGSDYSDWHKHYSGTEWDGSSPMMAKPDWMSTTDYNRGMIHYLYGQKSDKIQGDFDAAVGAADGAFYRTSEKAEDAYRSEMAYNGVLYERMKKYMPLQQKRAGMGNMGIAQTGLAQITNDHMNRRSAIQGQYNDAIADASFARATEVGAAERARANSMSDLNALTTEEMMKIYAGEEADAEAKQQAAIDAFKNSITSYASAEDALAGLDALGLEATDPEYTALKTQIEGYFRDKEDAETKKEAQEKKEALDNHYSWLEEILMGVDTSEFEQIWNANAKYIDQMTPEQQARLSSLKSLAASVERKTSPEEQTKLDNNYNDMLIEVESLIGSYASDDDIEKALNYWKDKTDSERYQRYYDQVMKMIKTPQFDTAQLQAKNNENTALRNYKLAQEAATADNGKYGNDVEAYVKDVLDGKTPLKYDNEEYEIIGKAIGEDSKLIESDVFKDALNEKFGTTTPNPNEIQNGTTISLRVDSSDDSTFNWRDIVRVGGAVSSIIPFMSNPVKAIGGIPFAFGAGHGLNQLLEYDMTVTYFNGAWYPSKKVN
jgi:hypothetical protein